MNTIRALLFILLFLLLGCLLTAVKGDEIEGYIILKQQVEATDPLVRLKHFTEQPIPDKSLAEMLVCRRPLKDKPLKLTKAYIENLITANHLNRDDIYFDMPEEVTVSFAVAKTEKSPSIQASSLSSVAQKKESKRFTEIDSAEILLKVSAYVEQSLRSFSPQVSIYHPTTSNWKVQVEEDYDLKVLPGAIIKGNSVSAKIGVYHNNKIVDTKVFQFRADVFVKCLVAQSKMEKGQIIKADDFTEKIIAYRPEIHSYLKEEKQILGLELQKSISTDEGVEKADIKAPYLIIKGEIVNVFVKSDGYSIRTSGVSQGAGRLGETIEILLKGSAEKINAVITGDKSVELNNL